MPFRFTPLAIPDAVLVEPTVNDLRGWFVETSKASEFARAGITMPFVQDNPSRPGRGALRGLHYQTRACAHGKLIRFVAWGVCDVAVDIRRCSPTFGTWVGATLAAANPRMVYIPPGFAHGPCVVSDRRGGPRQNHRRVCPGRRTRHCLERPRAGQPLAGRRARGLQAGCRPATPARRGQ